MNFCCSIDNVEVDLTIDSDIVQQSGKDFIEIKAVQPNLGIDNLSVKSRLTNKLINSLFDSVINSNWQRIVKSIDPLLKKYIAEMIKSILSPILDKIAIQDFIQE